MKFPTRCILSALLPLALGASPALAANVDCDAVLDGVDVVLDGDVGPCFPGQEITVQNGGSLDLDGHVVRCTGGAFGVGVTVSNGGTLRNGTVTGCELAGVQVTGASGALVENVVSRDNTGMGFAIYSTGASTLRYNTASGNDDDGFFVSASGSKLTSNSAWDNGADGFEITGSGLQMTSNRSAQNFLYGFAISGSEIRMKSNRSTGNGNMGFYVTGNGNSLGASVADGESYGFYISGNDNTLSKSLASAGYVGLYLNGDGNTVSGCRFADGAQGITQGAFADNNSLKKNQAWGNTVHDFGSESVTCGTNEWSGNLGGKTTDACMD